MACCSSFARSILPVLLGIISYKECAAFLANPSWSKQSPICSPSSLLAKDSRVDVRADGGSHPEHSGSDSPKEINRRRILSLLQTTPLLMYQSASAQVEAIADAPAPQINAAQKATPRMLCADSEEENRIAVFQRVAPSVVYIDTFAEKRDVFSTNV